MNTHPVRAIGRWALTAAVINSVVGAGVGISCRRSSQPAKRKIRPATLGSIAEAWFLPDIVVAGLAVWAASSRARQRVS
jgi:hypothetical protein